MKVNFFKCALVVFALGFFVSSQAEAQKLVHIQPVASYGVGIDDVIVEWQERRGADAPQTIEFTLTSLTDETKTITLTFTLEGTGTADEIPELDSQAAIVKLGGDDSTDDWDVEGYFVPSGAGDTTFDALVASGGAATLFITDPRTGTTTRYSTDFPTGGQELFINGNAYNDLNNNGVFDPGDTSASVNLKVTNNTTGDFSTHLAVNGGYGNSWTISFAVSTGDSLTLIIDELTLCQLNVGGTDQGTSYNFTAGIIPHAFPSDIRCPSAIIE